MRHPIQDLDEVVHQRNRLGILAVAQETPRVEFGFLKGALGLTDGNLSRHLQVLEEAGYVRVEKGYAGRRPRTWIQITRAGRKALAREVEALRELVSGFGAEKADGSPSVPGA